MKYAIKAGILAGELPVDDILDRRFIPDTIAPARIDADEAAPPPG
jgi:hypothetical protein